MSKSGNIQLQKIASDRAAKALAVNDGRAESSAAQKHEHLPKTVLPVPPKPPVAVSESAPQATKPFPEPAITEATVEAAIVAHRAIETPTARPNMAPIIKQRVASVGAGSTRSVPHATPFVPNVGKPIKSSSVGGGQAKRPAPEPVVAPVPAAPVKPGVVTAASIAAAIAASKPTASAPRAMATGRNTKR
jgi:hypothetical protein